MTRVIRLRPLPLAVALATTVALQPAWSQEVGKTTAVNPATTGTPPARPTRVLELGSTIIHKERITTTPSGNVQILFVDKTTLNIGPGSEIVIDEFVYDPSTGTGKMAATMVKGLLRFVGGNTSHTGGALVQTPVATVGIRGGVGTISYTPQDGLKAINNFGIMTITGGGVSEIIRRPGFEVSVAGLGAPPSKPVRVSQAEIDTKNGKLTSGPKQSGGARSKPTETIAAANGLGQTNAAAIAGAIVSQQRQTVAAARQGPLPITPPVSQDLVRQAQDQAVVQQIAEERPPEQPTRPTVAAKGKAFALVTSPAASLNSSVPYVLGSIVTQGGASVSQVLGYRNEGPDADGRLVPAGRTMQVGLGINGQGASQSSTFLVATGAFETTNDGKTTYNGGFAATSRASGGAGVSTARGSLASVPGSTRTDADWLPTEFKANQYSLDASGAVVSASATARPAGGAAQAYGFEQTFARATPPTNLGQSRPEASLFGFSGGLVQTVDASRTAIEPSQPLFGVNEVFLGPSTSRVQMNQGMIAERYGSTSTTAPTGGFEDATIQLGGLDTKQPANSAYVDYDTFAARETNYDAATAVHAQTVNGDPIVRQTSAMTTASAANAQVAFPGVTFCQCEYTRWGFWSTEIERMGPGGVTYMDRVHLGTWVSGQVPDATEIPTTGTATYTGHVIASIRNNANEYIAAGSFKNTVDFATGNGTATVGNLDGRTYTGTTYFTPGSTFIAGGLMSGTSTSMSLLGSFYRGPGGPVQEMGGNVTINGLNYVGSGIFAGRAN